MRRSRDALDGVTAVQARIAQIQQLVSGTIVGAGATAPPTRRSSDRVGNGRAVAGVRLAARRRDGDRHDASDPLSDSSSDGSGSVDRRHVDALAAHAALAARPARDGQRRPRGTDRLAATGLGGTSSTRGSAHGRRRPSGHGDRRPRHATPRRRRSCRTRSPSRASRTSTARPRRSPTRTRRRSTAPSSRSGPRPAPGVTIPDGATAQYLYIRDHGDTMTVQQALHTPGALLFHFSHEPQESRRHPRRRSRRDQPRRRRAHDRGPRPRVRHQRLRQRRGPRLQLRRHDPRRWPERARSRRRARPSLRA